MAGNTINFELRLNSNIRQQTRQAQDLNRELDKADRAKVTTAAAQNIEYGRARGAMGATGATARDFANQAQGLGGLVRIYATVAANTFAAVSAFNALKQAADTTNIVRGLDQLGASSGIALGTLAKQFAAATDNAISFRDAAQSAAKATSAGLSGAQFLKLGDVAKKASQALGIDLSDAVNRLTRGITKLEPELLDELGIFTKIGPATEEYARKIGKTASTLTDFERRQAFANAVLEEGAQKFGQINIPVNPYNQLEASIKNLTQSALELINKVLIPITSVFANNSLLLAGALALIAGKLTKMAIPALVSWRSELAASADDAKRRAQMITQAFGEIGAAKVEAKFNVPGFKQQLTQAEQAYANSRKTMADIDKTFFEKRGTKTYAFLRGAQDIGAVDTATIRKELPSIQREINRLDKIGTDQTKLQALALRDVKTELLGILAARRNLNQAQQKVEEEIDREGIPIGERARQRISQRASSRAERLGILSRIGENVEAGGLRYGLSELNREVSSSQTLSGWDRFRSRVGGTFAALTTQAGIFLRAFGVWGQVAAVAAAAFALIDSWLSKTGKQMQEFTQEVELNESTVRNSINTLKLYNQTISTESLAATGTAIGELSDRIDALTTKFTDILANQGTWDKVKQSILGLFGQSVSQDFANQVAQNWIAQIDAIPEGAIKTTAINKLKDVLNIQEVSKESIQRAIESSKDVSGAAKAGQAALEPGVRLTRNLGAAAQQTKESIKELTTASQELQNSFVQTTPITKFANALISASVSALKSFEDMNTVVAGFKELEKAAAAFSLLPGQGISKQAAQAIKAGEQMLVVERERAKLIRQREPLEARLAEVMQQSAQMKIPLREGQEGIQTVDPNLQGFMVNQQLSRANKLLAEIRNIKEQEASLDKVTEYSAQAVQDAIKEFAEKFRQNIVRGLNILRSSIDQAIEQGRIQVLRTITSAVTGPGSAEINFDIKNRELDLQQRLIEETANLADTLLDNSIVVQQNTLARETAELRAKAPETLSILQREQLENAPQQQAELQLVLDALRTRREMGSEEISKLSGSAQAFAIQRAQRTIAEREKRQQTEDSRNLAVYERGFALEKERNQLRELGYKRELDSNRNVQELNSLLLSNLDIVSEAQLLEKQTADQRVQLLTQAEARRSLENDIANLKGREAELTRLGYEEDSAAVQGLRTSVKFRQEELNLLIAKQAQETKIAEIRREQEVIDLRAKRDQQTRVRAADERQFGQRLQELAVEEQLQLLEFQRSRNNLTEDQYKQTKLVLDLRKLDIEQEGERARVLDTVAEKQAKLTAEIEKALLSGATVTEDQLQIWAQTRADAETAAGREIALIQKTNDLKRQGLSLDVLISDRQKAYEQAFESLFSNLADSIYNWMQTGKFSSRQLFDSLISDIARYELRLQTLQMWAAARPFLMSLFPMMGPGLSGAPGQAGVTGFEGLYNAPLAKAKGAAFDYGVEKFAKGGMFTNSIVAQPTLFKFAKGTGLMGEAGPEAIMPLKRDSNGNLGVRAESPQQNVSVVINNNTTAQATAEEVTDSRGRRRIEVTIGEMVAGEMSRPGSAVRETMRSNYNIKPSMVRR